MSSHCTAVASVTLAAAAVSLYAASPGLWVARMSKQFIDTAQCKILSELAGANGPPWTRGLQGWSTRPFVTRRILALSGSEWEPFFVLPPGLNTGRL